MVMNPIDTRQENPLIHGEVMTFATFGNYWVKVARDDVERARHCQNRNGVVRLVTEQLGETSGHVLAIEDDSILMESGS